MAQAFQVDEMDVLGTPVEDSPIVTEYDLWFSAKVEEGLEDLRHGNVISHDEVKARAAQRRAELLAQAAH